MINIVRIAPGREQEYFNVMKADFLPHFNKAGFHHVNGSLTFQDRGLPTTCINGIHGKEHAANSHVFFSNASERPIVELPGLEG